MHFSILLGYIYYTTWGDNNRIEKREKRMVSVSALRELVFSKDVFFWPFLLGRCVYGKHSIYRLGQLLDTLYNTITLRKCYVCTFDVRLPKRTRNIENYTNILLAISPNIPQYLKTPKTPIPTKYGYLLVLRVLLSLSNIK